MTEESQDIKAVEPEVVSGRSDKGRTWSMLAHLSALCAVVGIPFGHLVGPLVVWLIKRDELPEVDRHGRDSLNFQLSMTIYLIISGLSIFIFVGIFLVPLVFAMDVICVIIASIKVSRGEAFQYPLTIKFLK